MDRCHLVEYVPILLRSRGLHRIRGKPRIWERPLTSFTHINPLWLLHHRGRFLLIFHTKNLRHMLQKKPLRFRGIKHRLIFPMHPLPGFSIQPNPQPFLRGNAPLLAIRRCHLLENALLYQPVGDGGGTPS